MDLTRSAKYGIDRILAMGLLLVLSPLLALLAIAIRLDSPGSPLFLQERIGLGGRPFTIFKFRTMCADVETEGLGHTTSAEDRRITRVGAWLRRTGIDEVPQLLNILLGEMSFIGPRPTLRYQVEAYTPRQARRLLFRPGITGWAQVHGRNRITWKERIELDLHYVENFSLGMDLRILWRTLAVIVKGDGVYASKGANDTFTRKGNEISGKLPLVVIGAGGHARVVIDAIEKQGLFEIVGLLDDNAAQDTSLVLGYPLLGGRDVLRDSGTPHRAVVAIGSPLARGAWIHHLMELQFEMPSVVHPGAIRGRDVSIGAGTVLLAGSILNSGARLGRGVIINTGASVDHDCLIGDLVHVAPGARLAGNVQVGARTHIGICACVIQGVEIGADAIIGAGAAVVGAIPAGATAVGVPARVIRLAADAATRVASAGSSTSLPHA